jgi:hypothetical protein
MDIKQLLQNLKTLDDDRAHIILAKVLEDVFIRGQESGRKVSTRVRCFNAKKSHERERRLDDIRDEILRNLLDELKFSIPCTKISGNACKYKLSTLGHIDRFGENLFDRIESKLKEVENAPEQQKLF